MYLMRLLWKTVDSERMAIIFYILNTALLLLIFNLVYPGSMIAYPTLISLTILAAYVIVKSVIMYRFLNSLDKAKQGRGYKPNPDNCKEALAFGAMEDIHEHYNNIIISINDKLRDRNSMFSSFIHNMKTSLTIIELACDNPSKDSLEDISLENDKLKRNLEQALNILRLDEFSNDYMPERVDLRSLISRVINEKKRDFIYAGVYPKLHGESAYVYTDKKWCAYILEQIIANAVKYTPSGKNVHMEIKPGEKRTILTIRDEGIGIKAEDVPRVFDLFFTGKNGRKHKAATGIGLFMVKYIAKQLGIEVDLTSAPEKGTSVSLSFLSRL
ncbi:sensor histidine kinase [Clostridium sp. WLY-B-L2]|uniref:histidine kinase n=1 Tax=Clostridium aromativorans TaxID=2836848 RepID=A0ABS8N4H9_9CLOT|nr:sensor histidine kinase [Clostridium aromativorans]MCC9294713.1 sensor histidine kinase [Clostridium aromativorans]